MGSGCSFGSFAQKSHKNNVSCGEAECKSRNKKNPKMPSAFPAVPYSRRDSSVPDAVFSVVRRARFRVEKRKNDLHFPRAYDIVRDVNCNGGRFAMQRGKSGLHRAGSPSSRRMPRGQPRGKESATENRPPAVFGRTARVKRRCKRPPGSGAIRTAWQAPSGARPNRGRCRCPRRYQFRVLAA